jgi:hypothetical protein
MTECYSDEYMGKAGVGVVATLTAPSSGTVSFEVGSEPFVVDVFATASEQIPAEVAAWGEAVQRLTGASAAAHDVPIPNAARHVLVLFRQAGSAPTCSGSHPFQGVLGELGFTPSG